MSDGVNPPCRHCGYDGYMDADECGDICPECNNRP